MSFWKRLFGHISESVVEPVSDLSPFASDTSPRASSPKLPISLIAEDYGDQTPRHFVPLLASGWTLEGSFTMWEVAEFIRCERANYPDHILFGVLEDPSQAYYTSGHTMEAMGLYDIDPETQKGLHPSSFEVFKPAAVPEFVGLSHPSEFSIQHKIFMDYVAKTDPMNWHNKMMWEDGSSGCPALLGSKVKRPPVKRWEWVRDDKSYVLRVPVEKACEAIAVLPNGYFSDDLQPDENYSLAKALEAEFGFQFFGFGATYSGYMRDAPLTAEEAVAMGTFLAPLYASEPPDVAAKIAKIVQGEHTIFLAYGNR